MSVLLQNISIKCSWHTSTTDFVLQVMKVLQLCNYAGWVLRWLKNWLNLISFFYHGVHCPYRDHGVCTEFQNSIRSESRNVMCASIYFLGFSFKCLSKTSHRKCKKWAISIFGTLLGLTLSCRFCKLSSIVCRLSFIVSRFSCSRLPLFFS